MKGRIPRTCREERDGAQNALSVCVLMAAKLNKDGDNAIFPSQCVCVETCWTCCEVKWLKASFKG